MAKTTNAIKLNPDEILKSLPKGFAGVSIPKGTKTVFIGADADEIKYSDAHKAVKKLAKEIGLSVVSAKDFTATFEFCLEDKEFNKQMRAAAKACAKAVIDFYAKYGDAYRYDDETCEHVSKIANKVVNAD